MVDPIVSDEALTDSIALLELQAAMLGEVVPVTETVTPAVSNEDRVVLEV